MGFRSKTLHKHYIYENGKIFLLRFTIFEITIFLYFPTKTRTLKE